MRGVGPSRDVYVIGRLYLYRAGRLAQITRDHSAHALWQEEGERGPMPSKKVILQAIGPAPAVTPGLRTERFWSGDLILICTDGLNDMVSDDEIEDLMSSVDPGDLTAGCRRLIDAANSRGGSDNVTAVLGAFSG